MVWGLNVTHSIPALDEKDYWTPVAAHRAGLGVALR